MDFKNTISDFQMIYCAIDNGVYDIRFQIFPKANQNLQEIASQIRGNLKNSNVEIGTQKSFGQDIILISTRSDNYSKFLEFCDLKIEEKNRGSETKYIALTGPNNVEFTDGEGKKFIEAYNGDKKNFGARVEKFADLMDKCKNHKFIQKGNKYEIIVPENNDLSQEINTIADKTLNFCISTSKESEAYRIVCTITPNDKNLGTAENRRFIINNIESIFKNKDSRIINNGDLEISFEANSLEQCEEFLNAICIRKKDGDFEYEDSSKTVDKEFLDDIRINFNKQAEAQKVVIFANLLDFYSRKPEIIKLPTVNRSTINSDQEASTSINGDENQVKSEEFKLEDLESNQSIPEDQINFLHSSDDVVNKTSFDANKNTDKGNASDIKTDSKQELINSLKQNLNLLEKFLALFLRILYKVYIEKKSAEIVEKIKNNTYMESDSKNIFDECMFETTAKLVLESAYQQSIKVK